MRRPWTPHEDALLREMLADGATYTEVAAELRRSYESVNSRAFRLGLKSRNVGAPPNLDLRLRVLALLEAGYSLRRAALALGRPEPMVRCMTRRMARVGLVRRTGGRTRNARYVVTR